MRIENIAFALITVTAWLVFLVWLPQLDALLFCYAFVLGLGLLLMKHANPRKEFMFFQIALAVLLGPLGAIAGAALLAYKTVRRPRDSFGLQIWYDELSGNQTIALAHDIARDIEADRLRPQVVANQISVQSMLHEGSYEEKHQILIWISHRRDPDLLPLLDIAVRGNDPFVRSQAASILFRLRQDQSSTN